MGKPRPVPACLRDLPLCPKRKLPVPFAAARYPDGTGEFSIINPVRVAICARQRRCGICGNPLGRWVAFLGGPRSADPHNGAYTDPAMHERCAEASIGICTFIARPRTVRRSLPIDVIPAGDPEGFIDDGDKAATGWVMVITRSYRVVKAPARDGGTAALFLPGPHERTRRFLYDGPDGRLVEVDPVPVAAGPQVVRAQRRRPRKRR